MNPTTRNASPPDASSIPRAKDRGARAGHDVAPADGRLLSVVVARSEADLRPWVAQWERLAAEAVEPNVFYEPWMLLPALCHLRAGCDLRTLLLLASDPLVPSREPELCGVIPLQYRRLRGLGTTICRLWKYSHCFLCTPLLRADVAGECLCTLLDWLRIDREGGAVMQFDEVSGEGPFHQALVDCLFERQSLRFVTDMHTRALLRCDTDAEAYLRSALSGEGRRAHARRLRRLGDAGDVSIAPLEPDGDVVEWVTQFLELEAAGWKGKLGTALACTDADRAFLNEVIAGAFSRARLLALAIRLDGRCVAQRIGFMAGVGSFSFKTAFAEEFARYSPGALMEIENIRRVHCFPQIRWMDSCTRPDNALINRLWSHRRTIQSVAVATGRPPGGLAVSTMPLLRWLNRVARQPGV
jgi:hypothetical protein